MVKVLYSGPEGQANPEVGRATGGGDLLEPGTVYDVPAELADRLTGTKNEDDEHVGGSVHWERVRDYDDLTLDQLRQAAALHDVKGRSKMDRDELIAALRSTSAKTPEGTETEPDGSAIAGGNAAGAAATGTAAGDAGAGVGSAAGSTQGSSTTGGTT